MYPSPSLPLQLPTLPLLSEAHMLLPEYFQEPLGRCPSRGLGLLPPPPHASQPSPAPLAEDLCPSAYETLGGFKEKKCAVDEFSSVSRDRGGLRGTELCLVGVTRGFALPWLCLFRFILQRIGSGGLRSSAA